MESKIAGRLKAWANPAGEKLGLTTSVSRRTVLAVAWAQRLLMLLAAIDITSTFFRTPGHSYLWDSGVYQAIEVVTCFLAISRAVLSNGRYRLVWIAFSLALCCGASYTAFGTVYHVIGVDPVVSVADFINLSFYPFAYVAVILLMRAQIRQVPRSVWLDGIIGACACASVALVFQYASIVSGSSGGTELENAVGLAYPVSDVLIIALLAALLPLSGWRPGRVWLLIAVGLTANVVGDFATTHLASFEPGTPWDIPWDGMWVCLGFAPWRKPTVVDQSAYQSSGILAMPVFFALACVSVLFAGTETHVAPIATSLALVGVLGCLVRVAITFREIRSLSESRKQARTDELTELGNRRYFYERTQQLLRGRSVENPLALLVVDLDRFKEINDSLGHQIGDSLLRQLGPRLQRGLGKDTIIARLGGDEFSVVLDQTGPEEALRAARNIVASLDEPFVLDGVPVRIGASVGIALFPQHANNPDGLLQHADVAMYSAKRGHNGPQIYLPERDSLTRERLRSIHELRRSIEQGRLVVYYQPQIDSRTGALVGSEALVRLDHPTRGLIAPDIFLPLAEQAGLMRNLTDQVLKMVLDDCVRWRDAGHPGLKVSINLSVTNLLDVAFPDDVERELSIRNLDASNLVFEVTESIMLTDLGRAQDAANRLRSMGAEMSLDDYGTGYASLAYLRKFPLDELKLDRSFVQELETDAVARTFLRSAVDVAHAIGLRVVAEGIETKEVWAAVNAIGGDICQGYLFSRPIPADEFFARFVSGDIARHQAEITEPLQG